MYLLFDQIYSFRVEIIIFLTGTYELMSYLTNRTCANNKKFKAYSHQSFLLWVAEHSLFAVECHEL